MNDKREAVIKAETVRMSAAKGPKTEKVTWTIDRAARNRHLRTLGGV
jgi:hypothetical protein